jgi:GNAT superfamily N-acetyltransferase
VRVSGGSMRPLLVPGCVLTVLPCDPAVLRVGDVVVARAGDRAIAHRLVARRPDGTLVLRGDALPTCDPPVAPGDVLGRAVRLRRSGLSVALETPAARLAGRLLAHGSLVARGANVLRRPAVRAVETLLATAAARYWRRPRRLATAVLRPGPAEAPLLRELVLDAGAPACLPRPGAEGTVAVAIARSQAVGCALRSGDRLKGVYVRPGWRRLGIGRTLLEVVVGEADVPIVTEAPRDDRAAGALRAVGFGPRPDGDWERAPLSR